MRPSDLTTLTTLLAPHVALSKHGLQTLCLLLTAMISARTVNLSHLAAERSGEVLVASTYRRLQRFFQHVRLPADWSAQLIVKLSGAHSPWYLCLDRTNWKIGGNDVNILMLAIATKRFRMPLMWTILNRAGNSSSEQRIALMRRYLALFEASSIRILLADREFIGLKWWTFLDEREIPFAFRVKENQYVTVEDGRSLQLKSLLQKCRRRRTFEATYQTAHEDGTLDLRFAACRIKGGELLIIASNVEAGNLLNAYRKRWAIECLFGDIKTRGLNLEDTRLTIPEKLCLLVGIVALAVAWICRTATGLMGRKAPPRKKHGYYAKSWFRIGFDELRRRLRTEPKKAIGLWRKLGKRSAVV